MNKNLKKMLLIGIPVLIGVISLVYFIRKKKKSETLTTATSTTTATTASKAATLTAAAKPAAATVKTTTVSGKQFNEVKSIQNKAALIGVSGLGLKANDYVNVKSTLYNGKFKVFYVYQGTGNIQNIYIDTPFKGTAKGTVAKA